MSRKRPLDPCERALEHRLDCSSSNSNSNSNGNSDESKSCDIRSKSSKSSKYEGNSNSNRNIKSSLLTSSSSSSSSSIASSQHPLKQDQRYKLNEGYVVLQKARLLFYETSHVKTSKHDGNTDDKAVKLQVVDRVEARLASRISQLSTLLKQLRSTTPRQISDKVVAESSVLLSDISSGSGPRACRATLRLAALLDDVYMEIFISDQSLRGNSVPEPHIYLQSLVSHVSRNGGGGGGSGGISSLSNKLCSECGVVSTFSSLLCKACSKKNPQLAYLRLRDVEATPQMLDLARLSKAALKIDGITFGPPSGTMRVAEPLGCDTLRLWQAASRERVCHWSAFACPDSIAATALKAFCAGSTIYEVGAGTGYWAFYLQGEGMSVIPSDTRPVDDHSRGANEYHGRLKPWCAVKSAEAAAAAELAGSSKGVLFMCYPPPTEMGLGALKAFERKGGVLFAMAGEVSGDTGSASLERYLKAGWILAHPPLPLPVYGDTAAVLTMWRKKQHSMEKEGGVGSRGIAAVSQSTDPVDSDANLNGKRNVCVIVSGSVGRPLQITVKTKGCGRTIEGKAVTKNLVDVAKTHPTTLSDLIKAVGSLGDTPFSFDSSQDLDVSIDNGGKDGASTEVDGGNIFISLSDVKETRRRAVLAFMTAIASTSSSSTSSSTLDSSDSVPLRNNFSGPLRCVGCGTSPTSGTLLRDRLTRTVVTCGDICKRLPTVRAAIDVQLALRSLPCLNDFEIMCDKIPGGLFSRVFV